MKGSGVFFSMLRGLSFLVSRLIKRCLTFCKGLRLRRLRRDWQWDKSWLENIRRRHFKQSSIFLLSLLFSLTKNTLLWYWTVFTQQRCSRNAPHFILKSNWRDVIANPLIMITPIWPAEFHNMLWISTSVSVSTSLLPWLSDLIRGPHTHLGWLQNVNRP